VNEQIIIASDAWRAAFAGATVGVLCLNGVTNPSHHAAIATIASQLEEELRVRYLGQSRDAIWAVPPLPAYAAYYKRFGQRYHLALQLESVALKGKPLPRVAALVEAVFAAELRHLVLVASHDLAEVTLPLRLDIATGSEAFTTTRGDAATVKPGDMYVAAPEGILSAIITGPSSLARLGPNTTAACFVAYAPPGVAPTAIDALFAEITASTRLIAPDAVVTGTTVITN